MFQELCKRRNIRIRHERYAAAQAAAAIYNVNRGSADDPTVSAFDFVRDEKSAKRKERIREAKQYIRKVIGNLPMATTRARLLEIRRRVIHDLVASGTANAEQLFNECWPSLVPTQEEESQ